jgi:RND family efflux transporter MFP subunit
MAEKQIDLRELALERPKDQASQRSRRRPWVARYVVPSAVLAGFVSLLAIAAGEHLLPRHAVTVVPVLVTRAEVQQEGTPLFQAAGWLEPRPTPINVPALTEGVIEKLLVVEGQEVQAGEAVAQLIDVDAQLALRQAETSSKLQKAELERAEAELKAARLRKDNPAHLEAELADAESLLAKNETALAQLPFLIRSSQVRLDYARQNLAGKQAAKDAIAGRLVQEAQSEFAKSQAELEELQQRGPRLERERQALQKKVDALSAQLKLLIEESRQLENAEARCKAAGAELEAAELSVEKARLALDRTVIRAPITGRVLNLVAFPGTRVMGLESTAGHNSSTVVELYDPRMLQVRADVRLEDVPLVQPGQPVEIETASAKQSIPGTVLAPTSSANIQKNTLEVKVAVNNPLPTLRPEMLVTATFLAPPLTPSQEEESAEYERLLIPRQLVQSDESGASVWLVAADGTARRQAIELGKAGTKELVEVVSGVHPTDKLISSGHQGLPPGARVRIAGEDVTIGFGNPRS